MYNKNIVGKRTFHLGKIAMDRSHARRNAVEITLELRRCGGKETFTHDPVTNERIHSGYTPEYLELSICGSVWNHIHTDIICGGQCLDTIAEYRSQLNDKQLFDQLYELWKNYHLNGMHAGTPEQEQAIAEWEAEGGDPYDYKAVCAMLEERGLYKVAYTGISVGHRMENEPYKYGCGWIVQELPGDVLLAVEHLLNTEA